MTHVLTSFATASVLAIFGSASAHASDNTQPKKRTVETEVTQLVKPANAGFSNDASTSSIDQRVERSDIFDDLRADGTAFGWIDEDGTPLEVMTYKDEILFKRVDGRVSRLKMTDMSGVIEPQISTSAVTMTK